MMHGDMDIGEVVAPIIKAIVGLNFVRMAPWEAFLHSLAHALFYIK
jgi:hypothetical protein